MALVKGGEEEEGGKIALDAGQQGVVGGSDDACDFSC